MAIDRMTLKRQRIFLILFLAVFAAAYFIPILNEPTYNGRTARRWFDWVDIVRLNDPEYAEALKQLNVRFFPLFAHALTARQSLGDRLYAKCFRYLPDPVKAQLPLPVLLFPRTDEVWGSLAKIGKQMETRQATEVFAKIIANAPFEHQDTLLAALTCVVTGDRNFSKHTESLLTNEYPIIRFYAAYNYTRSFGSTIGSPPAMLSACIGACAGVVTNKTEMSKFFGANSSRWEHLAYDRLNQLSPEAALKYADFRK